ncbi:MAG: cobalamin-dependent protein [Desulfatibacillum sp.]|nr:cobalamin-dependent protein [Desulfatibacillum sp.]
MISEMLYTTYFEHLLKGRRAECARIVQSLLDQQIDIKKLYEDLFQKSLYEVGRLWETNRISVAREHLVTAMTEGLLNLVYPTLFLGKKINKKVVISCAANEFHQIGGKMAADIFEIHGWDSHFLGANTPLDQLLTFIDEVKPDLVGMSLSVYFNMPSLIEGIEAIRSAFGDLDIAVGGQALNWGGLDRIAKYSNTVCIRSMVELEDIFKSS